MQARYPSPRAMLEVMGIITRTHRGCDQHCENLATAIGRTALADGWGGSMVAPELSDIMFGTPFLVQGDMNFGVLKETDDNVIVHGHEPKRFESMLVSVNDLASIKIARG